MRRRLLALALVLALTVSPMAVPAAAQDPDPTRLDLSFTLNPEDGTVDVGLRVTDPGSLATLQLALGVLEKEGRLVGEPTLEGTWKQEGDRAIADLEASPNAVASWTADARIRVESLEGEGHTSFVGEDFAVVKAGNVMPAVRYTFPQDQPPTFSTSFQVDAPDGWTVGGPWEKTGEATFQLDTAIPRGFLAADDDLDEGQLGEGDQAYRILRVEGATEDDETGRILLAARGFLGGIYGPTIHQRYIVVAPDPMFRGGLGSPDGVFLHADADKSVVAHEMVHAFQGWEFSRAPGQATIWLAEGTAVVHGQLLEVAAGVTTRDSAQAHMETQLEKANEEHAVDLTSAVYGSGNEQAAYTKGAVVVTALDDRLREATDNQYTFADVLRRINEISAEEGNEAFGEDGQQGLSTTELLDVIGDVTRVDASAFFDRYVYDSDVPPLGAIFPGEASVRILGTEPSPPVADQPLEVRVALSNLDTEELNVDLPVLVNGTETGRLEATLPAGGSAEATAELTPLSRGPYTISVQQSELSIEVLSPPRPVVDVQVYPTDPASDENVTVGAVVTNEGQAPYRGPLTVALDGETVATQQTPVPAGQTGTVAVTLAPLSPGAHEIVVEAENGSRLAERSIQVADAAETENASSATPLAVAVTLVAASALLARAPRRT